MKKLLVAVCMGLVLVVNASAEGTVSNTQTQSSLTNAEVKLLHDYLNNVNRLGLTILKYHPYDVSEYTDGTGMKFEIFNRSKKTIKYIWFTVEGYNPVDDVVLTSSATRRATLHGVGPIKPDERGKYNFDYVWMTDLVESAKLVSIKIQYMDKSVKLINNKKDLEAIEYSDELEATYQQLILNN